MKNHEQFLETMQGLNPYIIDYADAIEYAMRQVPKVDYDRWFGEIEGKGVYYADSQESRWYPAMTKEMVATMLAAELL